MAGVELAEHLKQRSPEDSEGGDRGAAKGGCSADPPQHDEFERRRKVIQAEMEKRSLDALCVFSPAQVFYLTGFTFIATERPIGAICRPRRDSVSLFVPLLEVEHAEDAHVDLIRTYDECPGEEHPMNHFVQLLGDLDLEGRRIAVDADGYGGGYGYVGPWLSELTRSDIVVAKDLIERLMWIKSDEEIALVRESCKWGDLAHRLLQEYSAVGLVETDVSSRASHAASMQMVETLGPQYRSMRFGSFPAHADYRGQIGAQSAIPHSITTKRPTNALTIQSPRLQTDAQNAPRSDHGLMLPSLPNTSNGTSPCVSFA